MLKSAKGCSNCNASCPSSEYTYKLKKGLSERIVRDISLEKGEPSWMLDYRLNALNSFTSKNMPKWGPSLKGLAIKDLYYYLKIAKKEEESWEKVSENIKNRFEELGLPENERDYLAGLGAQCESEIVYHNLKKEWAEKGVIFLGTDAALKKHPELFRKYFGTVVKFDDNKFSALNGAVWSGGSFIYVPKNVQISIPLQAYYRIDSEKMGQFERTLIIADEDSSISYIEGCTAPNHSSASLHSAVVEIIAHKGSKVKYYTVQNWSKSVYNLVTKRALAYDQASVEWIDANIGSGITMKYPAVILAGEGAKASVLSLAVAGFKGQVQDSGAKAIHLAPFTSSKIISKSVSSNGGRASFRGKVKVVNNAKNSKSFVQCDSLLTDEYSRADAYPILDVKQENVDVGHEARVSKVAEDQIFYLMSRGMNFIDAQAFIVNGFVESFVKNLPPEYALEIGRLVESELKGGMQ